MFDRSWRYANTHGPDVIGVFAGGSAQPYVNQRFGFRSSDDLWCLATPSDVTAKEHRLLPGSRGAHFWGWSKRCISNGCLVVAGCLGCLFALEGSKLRSYSFPPRLPPKLPPPPSPSPMPKPHGRLSGRPLGESIEDMVLAGMRGLSGGFGGGFGGLGGLGFGFGGSGAGAEDRGGAWGGGGGELRAKREREGGT